jgi:phosphatidylglycerol---prolipoprotein diacylglyceryl transferase
MIVHNFDPVLVDLGLFQLRWYSIAYILGIFIGWLYAIKIIRKTEKNIFNFKQIDKLNFDESMIYIVIGIIAGGRFGYIIFYNFEYYTQNFLEIFKIWQGGMSFHGGLIGVILSILIYSKKTKFNFFKYADIISCVAPIGIFFGRIANFINAELYGKVSTLPWAVIFPSYDNLSRHPSQIYEAILEGVILFLLINYIAIKKKLIFKPGYTSCFFLIFYSILRIFSEIFREPDIHLGFFFNYFSLGTLLSFATILSGSLILLYIKKNEQNN